MIGYFPAPHPDELLYSVCARFQERFDCRYKNEVSQTLFGSPNVTAIINLPTNLDYLTASFPPGHHLSVGRLIDEHTLLPFYSPFLPPERVNRIRALMRSSFTSDASIINKLCGIPNSNIHPPDRLRFCPLCVEEDRKSVEETYWHRLHQVTGVIVCPFHKVFLEDSSARTRNREDAREFVPAEQLITLKPARLLNQLDHNHTVLLNIARDSFWLLKNGELGSNLKSMRNRYMYLLSQKRLAVITGRVWVRELLIKLKDHYSKELLESLQCDFDESKIASWPAQLVKDLGCRQIHHPLRHVLLMQFLGHTVETFFKSPDNYKPFGDCHWSCLNPACSHYLKLQINRCQIVHRTVRGRGTLPVGTFSCPCGFVYIRIGPDKSIEDKTRISKVVSYGRVWEEELRRLWADSSLDLRLVARKLGFTDRKIIKREAMRLKLPFPRKGPGYQVTQMPKPSLKPVGSRSTLTKKRSLYRSEWKVIRKENPKISRSIITQKYVRLYYWLNRYDNEWLKAHLPPPRKRGRANRRVNWHSRDATLAKAVRESAQRLKRRSGRPVRVTKNRIGKDIDQKTMLEKYLDKLPRTKGALLNAAETRVQFAKRRLQWAADYFRLENKLPARSALMLRASFGSDIWDEPEVIGAVESIIKALERDMLHQHHSGYQGLKVA
jgi:Tn7-like transposition protein D/TniQ